MKKNINNKGLSIIELLVCFVIVSVISITLLNTIMDYKSMEEVENVKNNISSYKNNITKLLQDDIMNNKLSFYTTTVVNESTSTVKERREIELNFMKPFGNSTSTITSKKLIIHMGEGENDNYIEYPDVIKNSSGVYVLQNVRYELRKTSDIYDIDVKKSSATEKKKYSDIRFLSVGEVSRTNDIFTLKIPIYHSELKNQYSIYIVAPMYVGY